MSECRSASQFVALIATLACAAVLRGGESQPGAEPIDPVGVIIDRIPLGQLEDGVILESGDTKISLSVVGKAEAAYIAASRRRQPGFMLTPDHRTAFRKFVAFQLFRNAMLQKYAADNKLEIANDKFEAQFEKLKQMQLEREQDGSYEQLLADMGLTDEELRSFRRAQWALEQKIADSVTDEEITKAISEFKDSAALRRASHILFTYKGAERAWADVTRTKEEAKAAAEDIIKKLKNGADFAKLAKEYSDHPNKTQGGDLDFFPHKGVMPELQAFSDAAYALEKVGDCTPVPIETPFGFHVIKLTALRGTDGLKTATRQRLISEKENKLLQDLTEEAAAKAKFNAKLLER
ncbi:MAG: peptidylprolyl isomerase [Planctomycetota bacterium]